ncbi:FecCD family ABC transporter permease [Corynebacterium aquilae]|uniref:Iron ABC transporter permease n=1 Tax=Corynebacterium aquilae DSM 44791 TaxID=1431546 RepID=A0A1L7CIH9_9CORY|nr:iron ABC transporter permease [Corynebacterium aquilae]APT85619.1 hypothetical protein CAQU_11865 [Corynebacterium aquilae DSM 44791]
MSSVLVRRQVLVGVVLVVAIVASCGAHLLLGDYTVSLVDFVAIVRGDAVPHAPAARFLILDDRLPRVLLGIVVGCSFGLGGTLFQLVLRNPLASPDFVGVSALSTTAVVAAMALWGVSGLALSGAAAVGGVGATALVMAVSSGRQATTRFVLSGVAVAAMATATTQYLLSRMSIYQASAAAQWLSGSLHAASMDKVVVVGVVLMVLGGVTVFLAPGVRMLGMGDDVAAALGVAVLWVRWLSIGVAVLVTTTATAASGPVTFVAFLSGPIVGLLLGGRSSLVLSALMGAAIVCVADAVSVLVLPTPLPVGVITGALGMPVLLAVVVSYRRKAGL